jgi:hypothetical protein|tara:strand:- start:215 stop:1768 length:1554 start_codon:yes stop_codon:yes gene_type:complete
MGNYAFLDIAQEFQLEIVSKFLNKTKAKLSYINTAVAGNFHGDILVCEKWVNSLKTIFPEGEFNTLDDFLYPKTYTKFMLIPWVITEQDLLDAKHIESMSIRLMDRSALIPISGFSRKRLYLLLLNYFTFIIESHKIDGVVVFDTPHSFFTHVMYELCKLKGLKIFKLEYHFLTEYSVLLNQDKWPGIPLDYMQNSSLEEMRDSIPENLNQSIFKDSEILNNYKSKETKAIVKQNSFSSLKLYLRYIDKSIKNIIMGLFPFLFKKEVLHFSSLNGIKNRLWYRLVLNKQLWKLIKLNVHYNKIANRGLSLEENYVFVGLHMQPEKTSQPMGGEYDNQLMLIKTLADSVPEGWKVYVKEHPNQFNVRKVPNRHYRDKLFYACLQELKNVELVPLEIDSEDLIQSSKMVATLTGTLGWEAITKNIPALVFGNTYYMACRAARKITSVATCKLAIEELSNMNDKDFEKEIIRYISYYHEQNWIIQTANWQTNFAINSLSYNDQINNIVDRLSYFHNKKQG